MNVTVHIALRAATLSHWHLPAAWLRPLRQQRRQTVREARVSFMQERANTTGTWRDLAKAAKRAGLYPRTSFDGHVAISLQACVNSPARYRDLDVDHRAAPLPTAISQLPTPGAARTGNHDGGPKA